MIVAGLEVGWTDTDSVIRGEVMVRSERTGQCLRLTREEAFALQALALPAVLSDRSGDSEP